MTAVRESSPCRAPDPSGPWSLSGASGASGAFGVREVSGGSCVCGARGVRGVRGVPCRSEECVVERLIGGKLRLREVRAVPVALSAGAAGRPVPFACVPMSGPQS
ncbi:hypothetical protein SVIO_011440 [Streptomyces violaceusniger]|uniref:Uncharacterized protein n=1 Tax=Streptomyces violaceusniger TaxID=68280 RepID=A0A4D4KMM0_STRVO|nr:hypothetical protein SVIO_011440 [Streptomyces violaceusniger]